MDANLGEVDCHLRLGLGILALLIGVLGFTGIFEMTGMPVSPMLISAIFVVLGLFLTATGYLRKCPLYSALGHDTA